MGKPQPGTRDASTDADLVGAALGGSKDALAGLLLRHWDTALALSAKVLNSPELAKDAVQEAAIAAMTDLDRLRSPERFGAWFCGIALNVSRRWLRQLRAEVPAEPADRASASPGPAEAAELADLAARVRAAVTRLPRGQRDAVLLFYLQGLSHREAAAELGISAGAVKARLHQGRASLAQGLAHVVDFVDPGREQVMTTANAVRWTDVVVSEILRSGDEPASSKHIMILAERDGGRRLPIWIGPAEATALAVTLEAVEMPRPFTYKLAAGLVAAAGATIAEVRITRLQPPVFYASVHVRGADGLREVDARPSDAVSLALAAGAPILVNDELLTDLPADEAAELSALSVVTAELARAETESVSKALQDPGDH